MKGDETPEEYDEDEMDTTPWKKLGILGCGGFGYVSLWVDTTTGQRLAIKKPHDNAFKDSFDKSQMVGRWSKEVEVMSKLCHTNIVTALMVPKALKKISPYAVLAMEYCSKGNLRQVLIKPEKLCGLEEYEVIDILDDISNALAYLHSCHIVHRDLKPENIVLQETEMRTIYKLIDLGYAKTYEHDNQSKSSVDNIGYVAPELFLGLNYTFSVDYWSFGLLTHEIITGTRPFLPYFKPSDWLKQMMDKPRDVIFIWENSDGSIERNTTISRNNHMSRCFLDDMDNWLKLALDWECETRGRDPIDNCPIFFHELTKILNKKIVRIFSIPTYQTLCYEYAPEKGVDGLKVWLEKVTKIKVCDQILFLADGKTLDSKESLLKAVTSRRLNRREISVYLYRETPLKTLKYDMVKPDFLDDMIGGNYKSYKFRYLKRSCSNVIYLLQFETLRYYTLLNGLRAKIKHMKEKASAVDDLLSDVAEHWSFLEGQLKFFAFSHKIDLEQFAIMKKNGAPQRDGLWRKWVNDLNELEEKVRELKATFNKNQKTKFIYMAKQRCRLLEIYAESDECTKTPLDDILSNGYKMWMTIQKASTNQAEIPISNATLVFLAKKCAEESTKLLQSDWLHTLFEKIAEADEDILKLGDQLTGILKGIEILRMILEKNQADRQLHIWEMATDAFKLTKLNWMTQGIDKVANSKAQRKNAEAGRDDGEMGGKRDDKDGKTDETADEEVDEGAQEASGTDKKKTKKMKPMDINFEDNFGSLPEYVMNASLDGISSDVPDNIIHINHVLRLEFQQAQRNSFNMIYDLKSLDWDSMKK